MRAYDLEVTGSLITTGSLKVVGDITAEQYQIRTTITQVTMSAVSGSSRFGDSVDDTHIFTGSLTTSGSSLKLIVLEAIVGRQLQLVHLEQVYLMEMLLQLQIIM